MVGAVIEPGLCLDLTTSMGIRAVAATHEDFLDYCKQAGIDPPKNTGGRDFLFRKLDCAVINHLHNIRVAAGLPPFDVVKAVFIEGSRIYPESGFFEKTHIQLCVRNFACIKGVFRVSEDQLQA